MSLFASEAEARQVIGGFLERFPGLDPVLREVTGHVPLVLKLELHSPKLIAEIDLTKRPLQIAYDTTSQGTVAMEGPAGNFHRLLLGLDPLGVCIDHKKLLVRGSTAKLIKAVPLFYVAPALYPFHLDAIGRKDLILAGERPALHGPFEMEDKMNLIVTKLSYVVGYALGMIKTKLSPGLDIFAALESLGKGLAGSGATPAPGAGKDQG